VRSHHLAAEAADSGGFENEIVPIRVPGADGESHLVTADETIRRQSTVEKLALLAPSFQNDEYSARFPHINWSITAGNSSQLTDGASAMLIMSETRANQLGLVPRARFAGFSLAADDPIKMLTGPIPATAKILKNTGLTIDQIDHYEINEAFSPVPLLWAHDVGADLARVNPRGGAVALGHPLGASGVRLMTTMLNALEQNGGRYGLESMCEGGGMANATVIERL
jgi:acetyl-CoA acyltransferase